MLPEPEFTVVAAGEGYERREVDAAVAQVLDALRHQPPALSADEVRGIGFTPALLQEGYRRDEVDRWLATAGDELEAVHEGKAFRRAPEQEWHDWVLHTVTIVGLLFLAGLLVYVFLL